jgi:hypothetical protein
MPNTFGYLSKSLTNLENYTISMAPKIKLENYNSILISQYKPEQDA